MRLKEDICALATGFLHADTIVESYILRSGYRMTNHNIALLIPVENQVRELDAKILLACVAARRGLQAIIGLKRNVESPSLYKLRIEPISNVLVRISP